MTNAAAIGYMIMAARELELADKQIKDLVLVMYQSMDWNTEGDAERVYYNS